MIIIEGTDKAGKTTFIRNLFKNFPEDLKKETKIVHFGVLPEDWNYHNDYLSYVQDNIILDRFVDSERAYGPVFRGKINPRLTNENLNSVYRKCIEKGAFVIYCNPKENVVLDRLKKEGDEYVKKTEQLLQLRANFNSIFSNHPLPIKEIDTSNPIDNQELKNIVNSYLIRKRTIKNLNLKEFRGSLSLDTKYLIYTSDFSFSFLSQIIENECKCPNRYFSFLKTRNTRNEIFEISSVSSSFNDLQKIIILGEKSIEDYKKSKDNSKVIYCHKLHELTMILKSLN